MRDFHPDAEGLARGPGTRISFPTRPGFSDSEASVYKSHGALNIHTIRYRVAGELAHSTAGCRAAVDVFGDLFMEVVLMGIAVANKLVYTISHATYEVITEDLPCTESRIRSLQISGRVAKRLRKLRDDA
jgi:hypothetical protein